MLYRDIYMHEHGYIVYRHCFDETCCGVTDGALAHKVAVFVDEASATDYCTYRNRLIAERRTDAL